MCPADLALRPIDRVEILFLIDNYVDSLLPDQECAARPPLADEEGRMRTPLLAEHGLSVLIRTFDGAASHTVLMDGGVSAKGLLHNLRCLEVDLSAVEAVCLSHGHYDHRAALAELVAGIGRKGVPLHLHPDAFLRRRLITPDGKHRIQPPFPEKPLLEAGARIERDKAPRALAGGTAVLTGQVERRSDFEKGFPIHYCEREGKVAPDPWIWDDQAVVFHVRGKGLVVLTGCGHSGIVNTVHHAREITGVRDVLAVLGGFHLTGGIFEKIIDPTVEALREIDPRWIVPTHCTGWKAVQKIQTRFPDRFIQNSVGTTFRFSSDGPRETSA